jgi:N-acyl-phosphatidylethanolamine-hydrolysing phospholipase D
LVPCGTDGNATECTVSGNVEESLESRAKMERRDFLNKMAAGFKSLILLNLFPAAAVLGVKPQTAASAGHYKSLKYISLREIAANRLHHGEDGRFKNPLGTFRRRGNLSQVLYWKLFDENKFRSYLEEQPITPVQVDWEAVKRSDGLSVTFIKHASVLIKDGDSHLIVDPMFDEFFWFIKDFSPLAFDVSNMPKVDHILITHGHYDHASRPALAAFDRQTHLVTPMGYDRLFNSLKMRNRTQLDWYDSYDAGGGRRITLLPCNHWTMRNPITGPNHSLWGSYIIQTASGKTIYVSGDTAFFDGFSEIGRQYDIDLAIMNLGAYEPRWFMAPSHMNPPETLTAFKQLGAKKLMVVHWGTFRLGDEPVHFPPLQMRELMEREGLLDRYVDVKHGQTVYLT